MCESILYSMWNFWNTDSWWSITCRKIVSKCLCYHDYHRYVERKWCRIHKITRTIDSWRLDTNCNGIYAAIIVSISNRIWNRIIVVNVEIVLIDNILQLHKSIGCCIAHICIGQKDRIDFGTARIGVFRHCNFLGVL